MPAITPTPSPTPTPPPVTLTLDPPSTSTPWEDRPVTFTGRISAGPVGSPISLWASSPTGWYKLTWAFTVAGGGYTMTFTPPSPGPLTVMAIVGGTFGAPRPFSAPRTLTVLNRTNSMARMDSVYAGLTHVTLVGQVLPATAGQRVSADYVYNGAWSGFAMATTDAAGHYRIPIPDDIEHHWVVRTRTVESVSTAVEYSASATFDVVGYAHPLIYPVTAADVPKTYRPGCPVGPSSLRRVTLTQWSLDHRLHRGELVVRDGAVAKMIAVWSAAVAAKFPVRQMHRVDVYGGNDIVSMAADNTSVFNCRNVTGNPYALSPHSYGYAIDINTVENPYQDTYGRWYPANGLSYRDRSNVRPGMLFDASTPTRALIAQGYFWGRYWRNPDYQHFEPR